MSKSETPLLSGTYASGFPRPQPGVRELPSALDQEDLGEDGDGDLPGRLVSQPQPDGRVQPRVLAQLPPQPPADVAQDQRHLSAAPDQPDVSGPRLQRRLQHALVERVATGQDHHEIGGPHTDAAERILRQVDAAKLPRAGKPLAGSELLAVVDDDRLQPDLN